ncbi:hypothetical protein [Parvularcula dongshanensis]|uniref:Uncharacterized protein n=1 Tax=Parvularcula dongshanensis TaxID=1173995 RepID=A0A840I5U6_9PROT|nr:hypothetical protein [Parvularcula dongshanensis]MBB4660316.1 hypothetical protein [Parvularcula dongshanensis]
MTRSRLTAETVLELAAAIEAENEALREGRVRDALVRAPERNALIEALEAGVAEARNMLPRALDVPSRALLRAAEENQKLLASVAAGLKEADGMRRPAIAYTAQGSSVADAVSLASRKL